MLLEASRTNSLLWSSDLTNAAWTKSGTGTATQNAVGLNGAANTATTIADTDALNFTNWSRAMTFPADSATHSIAIWIKKDADTPASLSSKQRSAAARPSRAASHSTLRRAPRNNNVVGTTSHRVVDEGALVETGKSPSPITVRAVIQYDVPDIRCVEHCHRCRLGGGARILHRRSDTGGVEQHLHHFANYHDTTVASRGR
jgi:hypothetical protein